MNRTIEVYLGEAPQRVGTLHYNQDGARESSIFTYDAAWLDRHDRFEIDPLLPLQAGPHFRQKSGDGSVFHHAIADTEPDGWARNVIRRDHAKRRAVARASGGELPPLVILLEVDDDSRVGALRLRDEEGVFRRTVEPGSRATPPSIELRHVIASEHGFPLARE